MRARFVALLLTFLLVWLCLHAVHPAIAQTPTDTPTPTPNPTLTNQERVQLATIAPPAQCGTVFTPCGAIPWTVPQFATAALPSPTLIDARSLYGSAPTVTPATFGNALTSTAGPSSTATVAGFDLGPISTMVGNVNDMIGQMSVEPTLSGTQDVGAIAAQLATNVPGVFSTIKGVVSVSQSPTLSAIGFLFLILLFALLIQFGGLFLRPILMLVRLVLQAITTFKPG